MASKNKPGCNCCSPTSCDPCTNCPSPPSSFTLESALTITSGACGNCGTVLPSDIVLTKVAGTCPGATSILYFYQDTLLFCSPDGYGVQVSLQLRCCGTSFYWLLAYTIYKVPGSASNGNSLVYVARASNCNVPIELTRSESFNCGGIDFSEISNCPSCACSFATIPATVTIKA